MQPSEGGLRAAAERTLSAGGPFARLGPGYRERDGQRAMAGAVADAIERRGTLVAEAGTGIGKTWAYLVPALLDGQRLLVSTATRQLQDQLASKDLPEVAAALGVAPEVAVLKGRSNYVCHHHLRRALADGRFERREDIAVLRRIERFAAISESGERAAVPGVAEDAPAWALATSTRENCLGQECDDHARCFVFRARQRAQQADVVVVNHHLFCADLALRDEGVAELLPTTQTVVFDEAHQLPEIASRFLGTSLSTRQVGELARDAVRTGLAEAADAADWWAMLQAIEQALRGLRAAAGPVGRSDAARLKRLDGLPEALEALAECLDGLERTAAAAAPRGRDLARIALRAREARWRLARWRVALWPETGAAVPSRPAAAGALEDDAPPDAGREASEAPWGDAAVVAWSEQHAASLTLHLTPLSVAHAFRAHRAAPPRAWVFVSATLTVAGRFDWFAARLGLEDAATLSVDSPFDYAVQSRLWVPEALGEPSQPGFADRAAAATLPMIRANRGRAFVLCTSLRMVDAFAERLAPLEREVPGLELLVQGRASRRELLERYRAAPAPVLIGSATFWEGVDVRGDQLSLLVIDKLPFGVPDDPLLQARLAAARAAGEDGFATVQLPEAAMALKQGVGRLIRSETDRGLLVVCDERLLTKGYGRRLLASLPAFPVVRDAEAALAFLGGESVSARPATSGGRPGPAGPR